MNALVIFSAAFLLLAGAVSSSCPGCPEDVDTNREDIQKLAQVAVKKVKDASNSNAEFTLVKVTKAQTKVVAGTETTLQLEISHPENGKEVVQKCEVVIWSKPWEKFEQVTIKSCTDKE